jgi:hypothetical protein
LNDIVGSIWEDSDTPVGKGRYFLVVGIEPAPNDEPGDWILETRDLDHHTMHTMHLTYDMNIGCFPFLENIRRIV